MHPCCEWHSWKLGSMELYFDSSQQAQTCGVLLPPCWATIRGACGTPGAAKAGSAVIEATKSIPTASGRS